MLTRARAVALTLAGLTLAACGNIHPGAAAVVDEHTISMKTLDQTAEVYCKLTLLSAQQQGATPPNNADMRRQAASTLVSLVVGRKLAKEQGLSIDPADFELTAAQEKQVAKAFPGADDLEHVNQLIEQSQELSEISLALGEKATGVKRTADNQAQVGAAGQAEITKAFKANHVKFSPRFGLSNTSAKVVSDTGSLSVTPADLGDRPPLPPSQTCS